MKYIKGIFYFIMAWVVIFLAVEGTLTAINRWKNDRLQVEETVVETYAPTSNIVVSVPTYAGNNINLSITPQPAAIDSGQDLKRGSFFSVTIDQQLNQENQWKIINSARLGISKIVRVDTHAFIKVCMQLNGSTEPLDFGTTYLDYPGGKAENFIVRTDTVSPNQSRCLVLEFVGIPKETSNHDWQYTMEWLGFKVPDEGTECTAYLKRAQSSELIKQNEIKFSCNLASGQVVFQIISKSPSLTVNQAIDIINQVVSGVIQGPWVFFPIVE